MPLSPTVNFKLENNNLEQTTPTIGVSCLLTRTTKGTFNDPTKLVTSISQFKRLFGSEVVPDGSPSNIEKALGLGSKLRIIRVPGEGYAKGYLTDSVPNNPIQAQSTLTADNLPTILTLTKGDTTYKIGFWTKTYDQEVDGSPTFHVKFYQSNNTLYYQIFGKGKTTVVESGTVLTFMAADQTGLNDTSFDYLALANFLQNSEYLEPGIVDGNDNQVSISTLLNWLANSVDKAGYDGNSIPSVTVLSTPMGSTFSVTVEAAYGNSGTAPTYSQWIESAEYLRDYTDIYQVSCSHIHQHLQTADQLKVHKAIKEICDEVAEYTYYIEVPKENNTKNLIVSWIQSCANTIGHSKWVAYFGGGIRYYNDNGILTDSDCIGTIMGLGDASATDYGYWKSFAGQNRGVIYDGQGPVSINYGSPSRYSELNELANNYANMVVVRDTRNAGKQTMLWHCFTSQVKQDSFKFLSIVRLVLYMKKFLRPILESYLEEPNIWTTWAAMYLEVKPELDDLVTRDAISEYEWLGDQNASSYDDLQINNEADVRQGKYKVILKFKDIVPIQEISLTLSIDKTSGTISTEINNE